MIPKHEEIRKHAGQASEFLFEGREYLVAGDVHQASEKGWGAAAHMAKAVALAQGWEYTRHSQFHRIMNQAGRVTGSGRLPLLHGRAEILHVNYYELEEDLDTGQISQDLDSVAEMLDILQPLTAVESGEQDSQTR